MSDRDISDSYVYVLFRWDGLPFYVGIGRLNRWLHHEKPHSLKKRGHKPGLIKKTISELGEVPKIKVREGLSRSEAAETERALISAIGRYPDGPLVNMSNGGDGNLGYKFTDDQRAALSDALKQSEKFKAAATLRGMRMRGKPGRPATDQQRAKVSATNLGRTFSEESRRKMSVARKAAARPSELTRENMRKAQLGRKHSPETIAKMRLAKLGKPRSEATKEKLRIAKTGKSWGKHSYKTRQKMRQSALCRRALASIPVP